MSYQSPITISEIAEEIAEKIIKVKMAIDVDKDELIKALQYDRNQYENGYADGRHDAMEQKYDEDVVHVKHGIWERNPERWGDNELRCSYCGAVLEDEVRKYIYACYCYHCGVKMDEVTE